MSLRCSSGDPHSTGGNSPPDAQLADKSYKHSWARFWFLLAGACWVAMLFTLASGLMKEAESEAPEMPHL